MSEDLAAELERLERVQEAARDLLAVIDEHGVVEHLDTDVSQADELKGLVDRLRWELS